MKKQIKETKGTEPKHIRSELRKSLKTLPNSAPVTIAKKSEAEGKLLFVEPTRSQLTVILDHFYNIGADSNLIGDDKKTNRGVLQKWFRILVMENQRFPTDLPIEFVLGCFFNAILQKKIDIKGFNLLAHMTAFHEYMNNYENELRSKWWVYKNPGHRPLALPDQGSISDQEQQAGGKERSAVLKKMYGGQIPEELKKYADD